MDWREVVTKIEAAKTAAEAFASHCAAMRGELRSPVDGLTPVTDWETFMEDARETIAAIEALGADQQLSSESWRDDVIELLGLVRDGAFSFKIAPDIVALMHENQERLHPLIDRRGDLRKKTD